MCFWDCLRLCNESKLFFLLCGNFLILLEMSIIYRHEDEEEIDECFTVYNSSWFYWGFMAPSFHFPEESHQVKLNTAGDGIDALMTGNSLYFCTEPLQSHNCTGPAGCKMRNPAGLATCQCTGKTLHPSRLYELCIDAAAFSAGLCSLAGLSTTWLHSHICPCITILYTKLYVVLSITVVSKLSGQKIK